MAQKEKQHALYMMKRDPDGSYGAPELVHGDDVEDKRKAGYVEPTGQKANGTKWNEEDDLAGQDAAADLARDAAKINEKKVEEESKEREEQRKANEKAAEAQRDEPDFKVQVVEPPKADKKKK